MAGYHKDRVVAFQDYNHSYDRASDYARWSGERMKTKRNTHFQLPPTRVRDEGIKRESKVPDSVVRQTTRVKQVVRQTHIITEEGT